MCHLELWFSQGICPVYAESYGRFVPSLLRDLHTLLRNGLYFLKATRTAFSRKEPLMGRMVLVTSLSVLSLTDTLMVLALPLLTLPWFYHLGASSEVKLNKYIFFVHLCRCTFLLMEIYVKNVLVMVTAASISDKPSNSIGLG